MKIIRLLVAVILGIALVLFVNTLVRDRVMPAITLPFGWGEPHYWVMAGQTSDHSIGVPFTMFRFNPNDGAYRTSNAAIWFNAACGVILGIGVNALIARCQRRARQS